MRSGKFLVSMCALWLVAAAQVQALPLWEIEGTSNRIYLLGSVHFLRAQDHPLPSAMTKALSDADVVVMEIDLSTLNPLEAQSVLLRLGVDPEGRDLQSLIGEGSYRKAQQLAAGVDIDLETLRPFEPWYAAMQITQFRLMQLGFDGSYGVEAQMLLQAVQEGKEIRGLETLEQQLDALDSLPLQAQEKFLIQTLEEAADLENQVDDIMKAWRTGNTKSLERELTTGMVDQPKLYRKLLTDRNENWMRKIMDYIDDSNDYLIVVGALHLVGEDGVPRMLEDAGYSIKQIKR
jgi:uncharacterized protein YbaP (TraB family)